MLGYRTDRFTLLASGTFWLSQTPDRPGKGWDAAYPRIASWARLRDRTASQTLLVVRSEEHTSELQSLMRISYAVFCLKKKNKKHTQTIQTKQVTTTRVNDK